MQSIGKYLIIAGIIIVLLGITVYFFGNKFGWFGNLPGDIKYENENTKIYFPIVTCIIISIILSLVFWLIRKLGE